MTFMMMMMMHACIHGWMDEWMDEYELCDIACDHADGYDGVDYDVNGEKKRSTVNRVGYMLSVILFISVMMMMMISLVLCCYMLHIWTLHVSICVCVFAMTALYLFEYDDRKYRTSLVFDTLSSLLHDNE